MDLPSFLPRSDIELVRGERDLAWQGPGLWALGGIASLAFPCVAIVGTRAATPYGKRVAHAMATALAAAGCTIVSGLALGIDSAAHEGALSAGGPTVGVLGSGHAQFFPPRNIALAERMLAKGAVLSPYAPDHHAYPSQFLERNSVVAALADAVVVVEAPARSGALNTAGWADGRIPVFVVPADVDRKSFAGSFALLRDGATLARDANDVLESLRIGSSLFASNPMPHEGLEQSLFTSLDGGELTLDELVLATAAPTADVLAALAILELDGSIERRGATRFARLLH